MIHLNAEYNRDEFTKYLTETFLPDFSRDVRPIASQGLSTIEGAHILGKCKELDLQIFEFQYSGSSRKRVTLTKEAFKVMQDHASYQALGVFYGKDSDDWRLSLMLLNPKVTEKGKVKVTHSNPRRYSYFLGPNAKINTPHRFLVKQGKISTLEELQERFDVEIVTKEFFDNYKKLYDRLVTFLGKDKKFQDFASKNGIQTSNFAKKLLGQIVFVYFLQRKGWLGARKGKPIYEGDTSFIRALFESSRKEKKNFYNSYLEPLFYSALNSRPKKVAGSYREYFDCQIPFLNGGLFEPPQNYDWEKSFLRLPDKIFSKDPDNPSHGDGILDIFDRYNFTIDEADPFDQEVSVDPEMLGKVFENLLEENLRKGKGTYYTPREIVHYMCQKSLINYLENEVSTTDKSDIRDLVKWGEIKIDVNGDRKQRMVALNPDNSKALDKALQDIKVVDPACGSGAFLVGMLQEIVKARIYLANINNKKVSEYDLKKEAIQNSIYGVDIDPGAVEIAKLRLWLSLVVDYELDEIEPLPNLDYKIMQGNSLLEELVLGDTVIKLYDQSTIKKAADSKRMKNLFEKETMIGLFDDDKEKALKRLKELQLQYFKASVSKEKKSLRDQIEKIEHELIEESVKSTAQELKNQKLNVKTLPGVGLLPEDAKKLEKISTLENQIYAVLDELKKSGIKSFFLWHLYFSDVFEEKGGFDVVIGNPPWVSNDSIDKTQKNIYKRMFSYSATSRYDLSCLFVEHSIEKLLNKTGSVLLVLPEHLWIGEYYISLREAIFNQLQEIDSLKEGIFEVVNNPASIMIAQKRKSNTIEIGKYHNERIANVYILSKSEIRADTQRNSYGKEIRPYRIYFDPQFLLLKKKILQVTEKPLLLDDIAVVTDGVQTARFLKQIMTNDPPNDTTKYNKALRSGKEIRSRYDVPEWNGWWILKPENTSEFRQPGFSYDSPKRMYCFKKDRKIILRQTEPTIFATIDEKQYYFPNSIFQIALKNEYEKKIRLEYLLGLLNSKLLRFYYKLSSQVSGTTKPQIYINQLKSLPIVLSSGEQISNIVDQIFNITSTDGYLEKTDAKFQLEGFKKEIDQLVYKLYGLRDEEIKTVEGGKDVS